MTTASVDLSKKLMEFRSITPDSGGAFDFIEEYLEKLGFKVLREKFGQENPVENLYARFGNSAPNLCFLGHIDVVPPGDINAWEGDPFIPRIKDGFLYGRGASDMKTAIAAWLKASEEFLKTPPKGSVSILLTADEEGKAINGTKPMLQSLKEKGEKIDSCLVGEPTNPDKMGEMIKIGRRGSIGFKLDVFGTQGHVAYPEKALNPITIMVNILHELKSLNLDSGTKFFSASNLEITSVDVGNPASNVIPAKASASFNIRFNDSYKGEDLAQKIKSMVQKSGAKTDLSYHISAESFYCPPLKLALIAKESVKKITGIEPVFSTTGGTSDARFMKDYCADMVEFGMINETAHKVNESARIKDIEMLKDVYVDVMRGYFA